MHPPSPLSGPPIAFAHRGARSERRENTLEAFHRALERGATGLESDAWLTADGQVALDHDGVTGPPWRRRAISAEPRERLPAHIPTLDELYAACGNEFELSLDVKDPAALGPLLAVSEAAGAIRRLWLCHHDWRIMARWRADANGAHLVESTRLRSVQDGLAPHAAALRSARLDALNLHRSEWSAENVAVVHSAGLRAFGWDAQTAADIRKLIDMGIDGVYSDHVDRMMGTIRGDAKWPSERPESR